MGRFKANGIIVRKMDGLTIVFYDKYSIYAYPDRGFGCVFHRWGSTKGDYMNNWNPFRRKLMRYKHLDINKCCSLASYHQILIKSTDRKLNLENKTVILRN